MKNFIKTLLLFSFFTSIFWVSAPPLEGEAFCPPGNYYEQEMSEDGPVERNGSPSGICKPLDTNHIDGANGGANDIAGLFRLLALNVGYFTLIFALFSIVYSGYLYVTAGGETQKMETAKKYITYAFIGMFFGGMAITIVNMVQGVFS